MDIRNIPALKNAAANALARGREPKKVILGYAGGYALLTLLTLAVDFLVTTELDKAVGLSNLGLNSILSTVQLILPMAQSLIVLCLGLGYSAGMMRIARGQYADHTDLKEGFRRFWPLLRCTLLQGVLYFAIGFVLVYPCMIIFMLTPFSGDFWELYSTLTVVDDAAIAQITAAMEPMMILYSIIFLIACVPFMYLFRMAHYILLDKPQTGAFAALKGSFLMMRRNCINMFKIDLHLWRYHLATILMTLISYGNLLLPLLGVELPWSDTVSYYVFYGIYLAGIFVVDYFLRNRAELTCIMAYEALRPREPINRGVVLGNIFQM